MRLIRLVLTSILFSTGVARADILFLDMNKAPLEIAAARRAAAARGERLIVIPNPSSAVDSQRMTSEKLGEELQRLKAQSVNLSSVVISGHDGNGHFGGGNGSITSAALREAFDKAKPLGNNVRSLLLWGCYTATPGSIEFRWKASLPNVAAVVGFDGTAPSKERLGSQTYLEDFLTRERSLLEIRDANQLAAAYNRIRNIGLMQSAACVNDTYLKPNRAPQSMQSILGACRSVAAVPPEAEQYACYFEARDGCEVVPANTPQSPLRTYYNHLQATGHCNEALENAGIHRAEPDTVIRLILFENVIANFQKLNAAEIGNINRVLAQIGAPADVRIGDLTKMNRAQIRVLLDKVTNALAMPYGDRAKLNTDAEVEANVDRQVAYQMASSIGSTLYGLRNDCVPFEWVEPNAHSASSCIAQMSNIERTKQIARSELHQEAARRTYDEIEAQVRSSPAGAEYRRAEELMKQATASREERSQRRREVERLEREQIIPQSIAGLEQLAQQPGTSEARRRAIQVQILAIRQSLANGW